MYETFKVESTPKAEEDLKGIYDYIKITLKNKSAADKLKEKFIEAFIKLKDFPQKGTTYKIYKKIYINNYTVFYQIDNTKKLILVYRILYRRMNIEKQL
jgi:addiction module RelE/StbE family toxin